ncbi:glycosyltransferase family 2 protein [Rhodovulum sp. DZ06]|uniref:glycosyltransferase family 2 protein n=1 Tax=Rhodovulum sp. DZ06 TaxID=3425126 RepID=UPI003D327350
MTADLPTISVVIPVYNTGMWALDAIDSILGQTLLPVEALLVDDGSARATAQLLDRAEAAHPGLVKVVRHDANRGVAAARNSGIAASSGQVLVMLDGDDMLSDPGVLEEIARSQAAGGWDMMRLRMEFWRQDPVSGAIRRWDDPADAFIPGDLSGVTARQVPALFQSRANWQFAYRRGFLDAAGLRFDEELKRREDWPFLVHALLKAERVESSSRIGFLYRQRPGSIMHEPVSGDLAFFARGAEMTRERVAAAGECQGPARFIMEIQYLTGLRVLVSPFLAAGEEDAVREMLTRMRKVCLTALPEAHPGAGPGAAEAFQALWPRLARQSHFSPAPTKELENGWLAALHAALLEGEDAALELLWAARAAPRAALAAGRASVAMAAAEARQAAHGAPPASVHAAPAPRRAGGAKPRLLLHVGLTKTGSTSLQNFFELNRARLMDRGVIYPEAGVYREEGTDRGSGHNMALREVFRDGPRPVFDAMCEEILSSGASLAIVSCENLSWNPDWRGPAGLAALSRALEGFETHPLMIVRDEFDWLVSMYKEAVVGGWLRWAESPAEFFRMQDALGGVDFAGIMAGFAGAFGVERCHMIDVHGEGELARRALACVAPDLAADDGLLAPPRANIGTPDADAAAWRLLNRLPAEGAVDRAFLSMRRDAPPSPVNPIPRIDAMLDGIAERREASGRAPWSADQRTRLAERLSALWGSRDVNLAAELLTERVRWARRPAAASVPAPEMRPEAEAADPVALTPIERMLDHDSGEEARRIRKFGAARPYGFSVAVDVDAGIARIESAKPLGELRLVWDALDGDAAPEEGAWSALPDGACIAAIPLPRRRFAAHQRLTVFARAGKRVWRREICLAVQGGAPFALVIGGAADADGAAPRVVQGRDAGRDTGRDTGRDGAAAPARPARVAGL